VLPLKTKYVKRLALPAALIVPLLVVAGFIVTNVKKDAKVKEPAGTFYETPLNSGRHYIA